jgi:sRNA-binding carbon storage regulator CsrA
MLVLRRKRHQSVVLGDQVTVTVEEISAGDGQRIFGATMQLGFQSPPHVSIYRGELRADGSRPARTGGKTGPAPPRPGKTVEISDAQARLRIEVPPKVPVRCNGTPTAGVDSQETPDGSAHVPKQVYHITCHKEDRITICHNITIAALNFQRFVFSETR